MKILFLLFLAIFPIPGMATALSFETCRQGKNDYLDREIIELYRKHQIPEASCIRNEEPTLNNLADFSKAARAARDLSNEREFPIQCIISSMKSAPNPGSGIEYASCNGSSTKPKLSGLAKPCISQTYSSFVYKSFVDSMKCLGINPREVFPMFGRESGFEINIGNSANNWGIGQLTVDGVKRFNWPTETKALREKPTCAAVHKELMNGMSPQPSVCERIGIPENPARSFLYAGMMYLQYKNLAERALVSLKGSSNLTPADFHALTVDITRKMYNGGPGAVSQGLKAFLNEDKNSQLPRAKMIKAFNTWIRSNFGSGIAFYRKQPKLMLTMRKNVAAYADHISNYSKDIQSGSECEN